MSAGDQPLSFGKYKGRPLREVTKEDPNYIAWALRSDIAQSFPWHTQFEELVLRYRREEPPKHSPGNGILQFESGQYKNRPLEQLVQNQGALQWYLDRTHQHCKWYWKLLDDVIQLEEWRSEHRRAPHTRKNNDQFRHIGDKLGPWDDNFEQDIEYDSDDGFIVADDSDLAMQVGSENGKSDADCNDGIGEDGRTEMLDDESEGEDEPDRKNEDSEEEVETPTSTDEENISSSDPDEAIVSRSPQQEKKDAFDRLRKAREDKYARSPERLLKTVPVSPSKRRREPTVASTMDESESDEERCSRYSPKKTRISRGDYVDDETREIDTWSTASRGSPRKRVPPNFADWVEAESDIDDIPLTRFRLKHRND